MQAEGQGLILFIFDVLEAVYFHSSQLSLEEQIKVVQFQGMRLQSVMHLSVDLGDSIQEIIGPEFKLRVLSAFLNEVR